MNPAGNVLGTVEASEPHANSSRSYAALAYHPHRLVLANAVDEMVTLYSSEAATRQDVAGR